MAQWLEAAGVCIGVLALIIRTQQLRQHRKLRHDLRRVEKKVENGTPDN